MRKGAQPPGARSRRLLGFGPAHVDAALDAAVPADRPTIGLGLVTGDCICLTGQMSHSREAIVEMAEARGLVVAGLSRRTRLLVAADPDSMSGKARRAREYGVPVVNEQALLSHLLQM